MGKYEKYDHFNKGIFQWVRSDLKGKHRENCLCFDCQLFYPEDREKNCKVARANYSHCVEFNMVMPVWECPYFVRKD